MNPREKITTGKSWPWLFANKDSKSKNEFVWHTIQCETASANCTVSCAKFHFQINEDKECGSTGDPNIYCTRKLWSIQIRPGWKSAWLSLVPISSIWVSSFVFAENLSLITSISDGTLMSNCIALFIGIGGKPIVEMDQLNCSLRYRTQHFKRQSWIVDPPDFLPS